MTAGRIRSLQVSASVSVIQEDLLDSIPMMSHFSDLSNTTLTM